MRPIPFRFVLMRPRFPENLGAAARALKNFSLSDWAVVAPEVEDLEPARRMAVNAEDVLEARRTFSSLDEAVADCVWVVGTSSRKVRGKRRLTPRQLAEGAIERMASGTTALVFGDERSGLRNEEVERCHDLSAIPTSDEQPSVNLAQSILLYAYELRVAELASTERPAPPSAAVATDAQLRLLEQTVDETLHQGGFLVDEGRSAVRELVAPWVRARLTRKEASLWMAALKCVGKRR